MTKTVFIYDQCGESEISFFVKDGDYSHMHKTYVNSTLADRAIEQELLDMLFKEDGDFNEETQILKEFPLDNVISGAIVVIVGFLP
jgi:hypothetical protein